MDFHNLKFEKRKDIHRDESVFLIIYVTKVSSTYYINF